MTVATRRTSTNGRQFVPVPANNSFRVADNSGAKKAPTSLLIGIALSRVSPSIEGRSTLPQSFGMRQLAPGTVSVPLCAVVAWRAYEAAERGVLSVEGTPLPSL
jgi:hypothetical protein